MSKDIGTTLDLCLDKLKEGKSIEYCLNLYPELAAELEPLLHLTKDLEGVPKPEPRKEAINLALIKMGEAAAAGREKKTVIEKLFPRPFVFRPAFAKALTFALILIFAVWSMGFLSSRSIPGNLLYPLKLATEKVKFTLTRSPEGKVELRLTLADRRLEELVRTVEQKGSLDESLVRNLLKEAELALDEAEPMDEEQFELFLTKLNHITEYQKTVLEQLKPRVPAEERKVLDRAVDICSERCKCLKKMMNGEHSKKKSRCWTPECRCQ